MNNSSRRRKQTNPVRLVDHPPSTSDQKAGKLQPPPASSSIKTNSFAHSSTPSSSSSNNRASNSHIKPTTTSPVWKSKKFSDFSISSQLSGKQSNGSPTTSNSSAKPSKEDTQNPFSSFNHPYDFTSAQKAYETLLLGGGMDQLDNKECKDSANALSAMAALFSSAFHPAGFNPFAPTPTDKNPLLSMSRQVESFGRMKQSNGSNNWMSVKGNQQSHGREKGQGVVQTNRSTNGQQANGQREGSHHRKRPAPTAGTPSRTAQESDKALDLSVKKPSRTSNSHPEEATNGIQQSPSSSKTDGDALNRLSSLVTTVGAGLNTSLFAKSLCPSDFNGDINKLSSLWFPTLNDKMEHSESNSVDPSNIFTCLQCFERFQSMEQLVRHMEKTKHFTAPSFSKHLNSTSSAALSPNNRSTTSSPSQKHETKTLPATSQPSMSSTKSGNNQASTKKSHPSNGNQQSHKSTRHNHSNHHGTFSFKCIICGHSSSENSIDEHMTKSHSFTHPNEWISAVKLIPL